MIEWVTVMPLAMSLVPTDYECYRCEMWLDPADARINDDDVVLCGPCCEDLFEYCRERGIEPLSSGDLN